MFISLAFVWKATKGNLIYTSLQNYEIFDLIFVVWCGRRRPQFHDYYTFSTISRKVYEGEVINFWNKETPDGYELPTLKYTHIYQDNVILTKRATAN